MKIFALALLPLLAVTAHSGHGDDTLTWSISDTKLPQPVSDMTATLVADEVVYIAGGCISANGNVYNDTTGFFDCAESTDSFYSFDAATETFDTLPPLPRPRYRHGAAFSNNRIWLVGGRTPGDELILEVDVFDITTNAWTTPGSLPMGTSDNAAFADGNSVFIAGGWTVEYIALTNVWRIQSDSVDELKIEAATPLQEARGDVKAVVNVEKGLAFIAGGFTDVNFYCPPLGTVEQYNIASDAWIFLDELKSPRGDKALVELEGHLVAVGGETQVDVNCAIDNPDPGEGTVVIDDVERLNDQGIWEIVASIPDSRFRFDAVSIGDKIYTFGGQNAFDNECSCYSTTDEILIFTEGEDEPGSGAATASVAAAAFMATGLFLFDF